MNEPKFTPGPWRIKLERDPEVSEDRIGIKAGRQIPRHWVNDNNPEHTEDWIEDELTVVELGYDRDCGYPEGGITTMQDAYLIAAAPDLYTALERVADQICFNLCPSVWRTGEMQPHCDECKQCRAALAKARGEAV